ncbi:MAG: UDP-2,3-diacylglucosamine diphosphatase LpxI [Pseudomonadota bacterium]
MVEKRPASNRWRKLGVIAGGGPLPGAIARHCMDRGDPFFVVGLNGFADENVAAFPGACCGIAEAGKLIRILKEENCDAVVLAGLVTRPDFSKLRPDWRGAALLPKVIEAARGGDGALLNVLVQTLESEGFIVIGAEEAHGGLCAGEGAMGAVAPNQSHLADLRKAAAVVRALGAFDIGQGAVVAHGHVLAVEAAEGTDMMLARCATFDDDMRGGAGLAGILVKRPKPDQELRVDLPTIGVETIRGAAFAKLAGVAVEAGRAIIMDFDDVIRTADELGLFVYGFTLSEARES